MQSYRVYLLDVNAIAESDAPAIRLTTITKAAQSNACTASPDRGIPEQLHIGTSGSNT